MGLWAMDIIRFLELNDTKNPRMRDRMRVRVSLVAEGVRLSEGHIHEQTETGCDLLLPYLGKLIPRRQHG